MEERLREAVYGLAVGDAVGVPYEFKRRGSFQCAGMIGYGTHDQPAGTWSDDTSKISKEACIIYVRIAQEMLAGMSTQEAIEKHVSEKSILHRLRHICRVEENEIRSSGYVVDSFEAAMWSLLTTHSYKECIKKAVNLGDDTDTVAAIAGGLAGILYGIENIPKEWMEKLQGKEIIDQCLW